MDEAAREAPRRAAGADAAARAGAGVGELPYAEGGRADARRNHARLLRAAEELIARDGVAAPVDDIAKRAGVGIGTVYRHFPTKEALLEAIVLAHLQPLVAEGRALLAADEPGAALFGFMSLLVDEASRFKGLFDEAASAGVDLKARTASVHQDLTDVLGDLLERAQAGGDVRADVSAQDLLLMVGGVCMASAQFGGEASQRERALAVVCDGLRVSR